MNHTRLFFLLNLLALLAALFVSMFFNGDNDLYLYFSVVPLLIALFVSHFQPNTSGTSTIPLTFPALAIISYLPYLALSQFWSLSLDLSLKAIWWHAGFALSFLVAMQFKTMGWRTTLTLLQLGGIFLLAYSLFQVHIEGGSPTGTFYNRNNNAALITLLLLPIFAWYISTSFRPNRLLAAYLLLAMLAHSYVLGIIGSRGAILAFLIGIAIIIYYIYRSGCLSRKRLILALPVYFIGFVIANIGFNNNVAERMATLSNPAEAGNSRAIIWERSLQMLSDTPWYGIGSSAYHILYRQYRHPEDSSYGAYAHNDYLQIAIEHGIPGLIIFLLVVAAVFIMWRRYQSLKHPSAHIGIGLFAAILATVFHSIFTFNFYILPILLVIGVYLAYLHIHSYPDIRQWSLKIPKIRTAIVRFIFIGLILVITIIPLSYGLAEHHKTQAKAAADISDMHSMHQSLNIAEKLAPKMRELKTLRASVYTELLRQPDLPTHQKEHLFLFARKKLDEAIRLSPLDSENYFYIARLYDVYTGREEDVESAYRRALDLDPGNHLFRLAFVKWLMKNERWPDASKILQLGSPYSFKNDQSTKPYYEEYASKIRQTLAQHKSTHVQSQ